MMFYIKPSLFDDPKFNTPLFEHPKTWLKIKDCGFLKRRHRSQMACKGSGGSTFFTRLLFCLMLCIQGSLLAGPSYLSLGAGVFDFHRDKYRSAEFRVEYKSSYLWKDLVRPMCGLLATTKGSVYVYGGIGFDFLFACHFLVSPNFAAGYYYQGDGKNLGFPLEFRSGVELGWQFSQGSRLGLYFYHISNASLGSRNPGEESIGLFYSIPIH